VLGSVLVRVVKGFDDGVAEDVEGKAGQVTKRIDYRPDQILEQLNLCQDLKSK
jgi:hypothetical protein